MNGFSIIADGQRLDTYEDIGISLNYQIDDILKIDKRNTNFSKTITIPGTSNNNKFFKQIFDVNINNINFNPNIRIPASITIGNNTVLIGNLQLNKINTKNEEVTYDVVIFGELKNIINEFGDFTLKNLDFSEYNHTRDKTTIQNSWDYTCKVNGVDTNLVNEGQGYIYPYIVNGNSTDIYDNVYIYDLFPSFYLKTYIDKMFEFAGFTYTSNFFNSDYFKKLIIPFVGDKIELDATEETARKSIVSLNGNEGSGNEYKVLTVERTIGQNNWWYNSSLAYFIGLNRESGTVDDGGNEITFTDELGQWNGDSFTCDKVGRYDIDFTGKLIPKMRHVSGSDITYQSGTSEYLYRLQLIKNDGTLIILDSSVDPNDPNDIDGIREFDLSDSLAHTSPWYDFDSELPFNLTAENVFLEPGDEVRILVGFNYRSDMNFAGNDSNILMTLMLKESLDGLFTKMDIRPSSNASYGNEDLTVNSLLSDKIKIKDMFMDVVKMFNLIIQDDPNQKGNLIIEPRDDFFKSKQKVKDWTQLVARDKDYKITPMSELDAKTYLYTYADDTDLYNKEYKDEIKRTYGDLSVTVVNDFSEKVNKNVLKFAPTPCSNFQIGDRIAPFFAEKDDESLKAKKVKPRILFYNGTQSITQDSLVLKDNIGDTGTGLDVYPYCGMWDDPYNPTEDLGFGSSSKIYWNPSNVPISNLYQKFHKATLNNIININSRLLEVNVYLTPKDIADFDFRDIIFIDGSYWRVNKIKDYNPIGADSLTKVVLYKIIDLDVFNKYSVEIPTSGTSCPYDLSVSVGTKNPYYISASGLTITEDCCKAMGGNYQNGVCYLGAGEPLNPIREDNPTIISGNTTPTQEPNGAVMMGRDGNSPNSNGVKMYGSENYVPEGVESAVIVGDKNSIAKNTDKVLVVGDAVYADKSEAIYVGETVITTEGVTVGGNTTELETTDASIIDAMTIPIAEGNCVIIDVSVVGLKEDSKFGHSSVISATYRNDAGTINEVGLTTEKEKTDFATANVNITISGTNVIVTVQGEVSNTIRWVLKRSITLVDVTIPLI